MIRNLRKYHYKINFSDNPEQFDVVLTKEIELSRKQPTDEMFFRTESSEWVLLKWQNPGVYQKLIDAISYPETVDYDIFCLVHYHSDGVTYTHPEYAGYLSFDGIKVDEHLGKISFTPKVYDNYTWYDKQKDQKLNWKGFSGSAYFQTLKLATDLNGTPLYFVNTLPILYFIQGALWLLGQTAWTVQSDFFTLSTNPVTGVASTTKDTFVAPGYLCKSWATDWSFTYTYSIGEECFYGNQMWVSLLQPNLAKTPGFFPTYWELSDRIADDIIMDFTLGEALSMMKKVFNCNWYISGNDFIIEHLKYFEGGLSYTPLSGTIIDLTDQGTYPLKYQILRDLNNVDRIPFELKLEEIPALETFGYSLTSYELVSITYTSKLASKTKTNEVKVMPYLGELDYFYNKDTEKVEDNSMILINAVAPGTPGDPFDIVFADVRIKKFEPLSGLFYWDVVNGQNTNLFLQNLYNWFHKHGRPLLNGTVDEAVTVFDSKRRNMIQNVKYPRLEIESTYTQLPVKIKTNKGNMTIDEIKIICDTGFVEVKASNVI